MKPHKPVLVNEVLEYLQAKSGGRFFDGTFGQGGHSKAILMANTANIVFATERDPGMIEYAQKLAEQFPGRFFFVISSFKDAFKHFDLHNCSGFLLDLGLNQKQLFSSSRGFSFYDDESLDCRINPNEKIPTGYDIVNLSPVKTLAEILREGGVGKELKFVLRAIIKFRPFKSAKALGDAISKTLPARLLYKHKHKYRHVVMQALRMAVNHEKEHLKEFLQRLKVISPDSARVAIISFHSVEDKLVTSTFRSWTKEGIGRLITKKAIRPSLDEVKDNPSSRSALLRVFEFYNENT